ncbi:MAG: ABC transporter permease [Pirellulaceae bacterium]|nr:ABC transporter permease [Pirellulaceae bacterium]
MRFGGLIVKNLARRPTRSLLTLLALATAIMAVVSLFSVAKGFTRSFADVYAAHGVDIVVSRQGSADRLSSAVDYSYVQQIADLPGVKRTAGVMLETLSLEEQGIYGIPTMGVAPDSWMLEQYKFVGQRLDGPQLPAGQAEYDPAKTVMLGTHLAERVALGVGERLMLFEEPYVITGIFQSTSTWENGSMILPLATLQQLTDRPGQVTYINVVLDRGPLFGEDVHQSQPDRKPEVHLSSAQLVVAAIEGLDKRLLALTTSEYVETDTRMQIAQAMAWMTSAIALLIGAIGTLNTMLTSVLERTKEIGILRAIGWSRRRVVGMIVGESCGLSSIACVLGIVFALGLTKLLSSAPEARGLISPHFDASVLTQGVVLGLGIGLLGAALPAWRAAQLQPTEAFRDN